MYITYTYRCLEGHSVISSDPHLDEKPCPAKYSDGQCRGYLDGPYIDIFVLLYRMSQEDTEIKELGSQLQKLLGIKYV